MQAIITQAFKKAYAKLNKEQKEAVDTIDGPVMVIAGPGTGKTEVLTLRIANIILKTDTSPESILALTFTESGAYSMRKRLTELIGAEASDVYITTFHGFSNSIIQNYPEYFEKIIGSTNINEADQIKILKNIIEKNKIEYLKPKNNQFFYIPQIKKAIEDLKREKIKPENFKKILNEEEDNFYRTKDIFNKEGEIRAKYIEKKRNIEKNKELLLIYEEYEKFLRKNKYYDYNDMILEVGFELEKHKELLLTLQEKYQYILVDEHQDTNKAQNRILELLSSFYPNPNLFVVGDAKQAIFRFQGASLENFLYFQKLYQNVKLIILKENYRSTQIILDAAFQIMDGGDEKLISRTNKNPSFIKIAEFENPNQENFFIAEKIKELIEKGENPEEIAVIFRENKDAKPIADFLEKRGINFIVEADENILKDHFISRLKIILEAVKNFGSDEHLLKALHVNFEEIPPLDIYRLVSLGNKIKKEKRIKDGALYEIIKSKKIMKENLIERPDLIFDFYRKITMWKSAAVRENPLNVFEDIVYESGMLKKLLKDPDSENKLKKLHALYDHLRLIINAHKNYMLDDLTEYLNLLEEYNIKIKNYENTSLPGRVRLLTAHKAKGQEFKTVFIANAVYDKWGSKRKERGIKLPQKIYSLTKSFSEEEDKEELNIFYVAITRAKSNVFITYSKTDENGNIKQPTKFIFKIKPDLIEKINTEKYAEKFDKKREFIFLKEKRKRNPLTEEKEYLNQLFEEQGLSVTAINNFLECPWKYFYRNLIRIPESPETSLIYGNAVHYALKKFFEKIKSGENPKKEYLLKMFEIGLSKEPIHELNYESVLLRGVRSLSGYYQKYYREWKNTNLILEKKIETNLDGIKLNGKLDKIEILDAENNVNVIDYKTGNPKSLNEIMGYTKKKDASYFRQLTFYKILLDNYQNGKFKMFKGIIDFVEPSKNGKYQKHIIEIKKEDKNNLIKEIKKCAEEIKNLSFWNRYCGDKNCRYCKIRKLI